MTSGPTSLALYRGLLRLYPRSFRDEYGIVCSYAIGFKAVLPNGDILVVAEDQPELLRAMRKTVEKALRAGHDVGWD